MDVGKGDEADVDVGEGDGIVIENRGAGEEGIEGEDGAEETVEMKKLGAGKDDIDNR
jgi:hypothetical protein